MSLRIRLAVLAAISVLALGGGLLLPMRADESEAAVSRLQYSMGCLKDGRVTVYFLWSGGNANPRQQWIDISTQNNSWLPGTFLSAGPFGPNAQSFDWNGMTPDTRHFVRVNQLLQNNSWDASPTYYIDTIDCTPR
jgi:hypothetical protein